MHFITEGNKGNRKLPYLTVFSEVFGKIFFHNITICFLKIKHNNKYGTAIKYKIPLFKLRAIELGLDFKELSAACLHIAHCASKSKLKHRMIRIIKKDKYFLFCFKLKSFAKLHYFLFCFKDLTLCFRKINIKKELLNLIALKFKIKRKKITLL